MLHWNGEAERMNAVFARHGLPTISKGTKNWLPQLVENIEKLSEQIKDQTDVRSE